MASKVTKRRAEATELVGAIRSRALPWSETAPDSLGRLLELIGSARVILLGEASHGTQEFYHTRARITQALIEQGRCDAVLVEADWPDAYRANRYVQGRSGDSHAIEALGDFQRFPHWMWRNHEVAAFLEWLRRFNLERLAPRRVGFYGLDLYSLYTSIASVIAYLETVDPAAAQLARRRYGCFERFDNDPQDYAFAANEGGSCEEQAMNQLLHLLAKRGDYASRNGTVAEDEQFHAEQNARLVANAERYYRSMFGGRNHTWNLRDRHMADTMDAMLRHLASRTAQPRVVVWAHNSHVGDARATQMAMREELNVGQLARERMPGDVFILGFTTYHGTVTAASDWDEPAQRMRINPALRESVEALFHDAEMPEFLLDLHDPALRHQLGQRLERAIGVIYRPDTERQSHYLWANAAEQFDAIIHIDRTTALEPLEPAPAWHVPDSEQETFPSGI